MKARKDASAGGVMRRIMERMPAQKATRLRSRLEEKLREGAKLIHAAASVVSRWDEQQAAWARVAVNVPTIGGADAEPRPLTMPELARRFPDVFPVSDCMAQLVMVKLINATGALTQTNLRAPDPPEPSVIPRCT